MIAARHAWLLRSEDTCFDTVGGAHPCRVCRIHDKGEVVVSHAARTAHLAHHRREKIVREPRVELFEDVA